MSATKYSFTTAWIGPLIVGTGGLLAGGMQADHSRGSEGAFPSDAAKPASPHSTENGNSYLDLYGDPLPAGATVRLGTTRFRLGAAEGAEWVSFSMDGRTLCAVGDDGVAHFWDLKSGRERLRRSLNRHGGGAIVVSANQQLAARAARGGEIMIWNLLANQPPRALHGHGNVIGVRLAFSADGRLLASTGPDGNLRITDTTSGQILLGVRLTKMPVHEMQFSPDATKLFVRIGLGPHEIWDAATGHVVHSIGKAGVTPTVMALPRNGEVMAIATGTVINLYRTSTGECFMELIGHARRIWAISFSDDGTRLASADGMNMRIWEVATGKVLMQVRGYPTFAQHLALSPDGTMVAAAGSGNTVGLWDAAAGKELHVYDAHRGPVQSIAFSADGRTLATSGHEYHAGTLDDCTVRLWDARSGKPIRTWRGQWSINCRRVLLTPDGRTVIGSDSANTIRAWDVATGAERRAWKVRPNGGRDTQVIEMALRPDGRTLVVLCQPDQKSLATALVVTWDLISGEERIRR